MSVIDDATIEPLPPFWDSLKTVAMSSGSSKITDIHDIIGPKWIPESNGALYWLNQKNEPFNLKFPALLNMNGRHSRLKPYFSLENVAQFDEQALRKAKGIFELSLIPEDSSEYPPDAGKCSQSAFRLLYILSSELEEQRNRNLKQKDFASVSHFYRENIQEDKFTLLVQTEPLFPPSTGSKPGTQMAPKISRKDLASGANSSALLRLESPSKLREHRDEEDEPLARDILTIDGLPDPIGRYAKFFERHPEVRKEKVIWPNVYDIDGTLISPADYTKLTHLAPVYVECHIRLWELLPTFRNNRNTNGSRAYQLILQKIHFLPSQSPPNSELNHSLYQPRLEPLAYDNEDDMMIVD